MNMRKNSLSLVLGSVIALTATLGCEKDATSESALSVESAGSSAAAGRAATQGVNQNDRGSTGSVVGAAGSGDSGKTVGNTGGATSVVTNNVGSGNVGSSNSVTSDISTGNANGGRGNVATGGSTGGALPSTGGALPNTGGSTAKAGGSSSTGGTSKTVTGGGPGTGGSGTGGHQGLGGSKTGGAPSTGGGGSIVPTTGRIGDHLALDDFDALTNADRTRVNDLAIVYGHRSHGAQMSAWVGGGDEGGLLALSHLYNSDDLYIPAGLREIDGVDLGTYLDGSYDWVEETNNYLASNPGTEVVAWAWCSSLEESEDGIAVAQEYLRRMQALEAQYPNISFIYMTQHFTDRDYEYVADDTERVQAANAVIRNYCEANGKWLFDFGDVGIYPTANGEVCRRYVDGDANNDPAGDQGRGGDLVQYDCGSETAQALECGHTNLDSRIRRSKVFYWLLSRIAAARQ